MENKSLVAYTDIDILDRNDFCNSKYDSVLGVIKKASKTNETKNYHRVDLQIIIENGKIIPFNIKNEYIFSNLAHDLKVYDKFAKKDSCFDWTKFNENVLELFINKKKELSAVSPYMELTKEEKERKKKEEFDDQARFLTNCDDSMFNYVVKKECDNDNPLEEKL